MQARDSVNVKVAAVEKVSQDVLVEVAVIRTVES